MIILLQRINYYTFSKCREIHQDCDELCHTERKQDTWLKEQKELKSVLNFSQLKPSGVPFFFCLLSFFLLLPLLLILPFSNFSFFTHFFMFFLFFHFPFLHLEGSLLQPGLSRTSSPRSALCPYHFHSSSSQPSLHTDPRPKHEPSLIPNIALRALAPTLSWPHSRIQTPDAALGTGSSTSTSPSLPLTYFSPSFFAPLSITTLARFQEAECCCRISQLERLTMPKLLLALHPAPASHLAFATPTCFLLLSFLPSAVERLKQHQHQLPGQAVAIALTPSPHTYPLYPLYPTPPWQLRQLQDWHHHSPTPLPYTKPRYLHYPSPLASPLNTPLNPFTLHPLTSLGLQNPKPKTSKPKTQTQTQDYQ